MNYPMPDYTVTLQQRIACYVNDDEVPALDKKLVHMLLFGSTYLVSQRVSSSMMAHFNIDYPQRLQQQCLFVQHLTKIAREDNSPGKLYRQLTNSTNDNRLMLSLAISFHKNFDLYLNTREYLVEAGVSDAKVSHVLCLSLAAFDLAQITMASVSQNLIKTRTASDMDVIRSTFASILLPPVHCISWQ